MRLKRYTYTASPGFLQYEFESKGPKGILKKVVRYNKMEGGKNLYNLAFGDLDVQTEEINDFIVSNNNDRIRVLATVAGTVIDFTQKHPEAIIFAAGSTPSRNRLYRMGISLNWREISTIFYVWGFIEGKWEPYKPNTAYEAFLAKRQ